MDGLSSLPPAVLSRYQAALCLFAAVWQLVAGFVDLNRGEHLFAGLEFLTAFACAVLCVLVLRFRLSFEKLGYFALALMSLMFGSVLVHDTQSYGRIGAFAYIDISIMVGLAYALLRFREATLLAIVLNSILAVVTLLVYPLDFDRVAGQIFVSVLYSYVSLHGRSVLTVQQKMDQVQSEIEQMTNRDQGTGLMSEAGMRVHLQKWWPKMDDLQKQRVAVVTVEVRNYRHVTERFGTEAGGQVIQKLAMLLMQGSGARDIVAKANGPQFSLLLINVKRRDVLARMSGLLDQLHGPLWLGGPTIQLGIGFALLHEVESPEAAFALAAERSQQTDDSGLPLGQNSFSSAES